MKPLRIIASAVVGLATGPALTQAVHAQTVLTAPAATGVATRETALFMSSLKATRRSCGNAAWTLWHSNDYAQWRQRRKSLLTMFYLSTAVSPVPAIPTFFTADFRSRAEAVLQEANTLLQSAATDFKDLSTYINARDFEADGFKKGDVLNARITAAGQRCHAIDKMLIGMIAEASDAVILRASNAASLGATLDLMVADWRTARALAADLANYQAANRAAVERKVTAISALVEERKATLRDGVADVRAIKEFYEGTLEKNIAVPMRSAIREAARDQKAWRAMSEDRPRSQFHSVRGEIEVQLADALLTAIRDRK